MPFDGGAAGGGQMSGRFFLSAPAVSNRAAVLAGDDLLLDVATQHPGDELCAVGPGGRAAGVFCADDAVSARLASLHVQQHCARRLVHRGGNDVLRFFPAVFLRAEVADQNGGGGGGGHFVHETGVSFYFSATAAARLCGNAGRDLEFFRDAVVSDAVQCFPDRLFDLSPAPADRRSSSDAKQTLVGRAAGRRRRGAGGADALRRGQFYAGLFSDYFCARGHGDCDFGQGAAVARQSGALPARQNQLQLLPGAFRGAGPDAAVAGGAGHGGSTGV